MCDCIYHDEFVSHQSSRFLKSSAIINDELETANNSSDVFDPQDLVEKATYDEACEKQVDPHHVTNRGDENEPKVKEQEDSNGTSDVGPEGQGPKDNSRTASEQVKEALHPDKDADGLHVEAENASDETLGSSLQETVAECGYTIDDKLEEEIPKKEETADSIPEETLSAVGTNSNEVITENQKEEKDDANVNASAELADFEGKQIEETTTEVANKEHNEERHEEEDDTKNETITEEVGSNTLVINKNAFYFHVDYTSNQS